MTKFIEQRVDELENQVAKLELIIHELRGKKTIEPSTTTTVEDIIEFEGQQYRKVDREGRKGDVVIFRNNKTRFFTNGEPYKVAANGCPVDNEGEAVLPLYSPGHGRTPKTVDVYELIQSKQLTPNQQRAAIIEKAKKFVEDNKTEITGEALYGKHKGTVHTWRNIYVFANKSGKHACNVEFVVDAEKRTITALMRGVDTNNIYEEATAKCSPNDVFNEHIGKAIALGRALGLDVSEFEQAVQPTVALGQKIFTLGYFEEFKFVDNEKWVLEVNGINEDGHPTHDNGTFTTHYKIINDTNAKYEVES